MAQLLRMPAVSADAESAVLLAWSIAENAQFSAEDILAEVETDKASVEIEADADGVILKMLVSAGSEVAVGAPIALLGARGEAVADLDGLLFELGVAASATQSAPVVRREVPEEPAAHAEATVGETLEDPGASTPPGRDVAVADNGASNAHGHRLFVSPLARRMARDAGLGLDQLDGSGPNNRIRRTDVEAAISRRQSARTRSAPPAAVAQPVTSAAPESISTAVPTTSSSRPASTGYTDEPHSKLRRLIAARLTESKRMVPHFYLNGSAQVENLLALRAELNADGPVKISVNDLVIKAAAQAHSAVPAMNAIWTDQALRRFQHVDIAVAVASERGLVTPTLRAVEKMSISAVSSAVKDFVLRAKTGKLRQDELEGGAISVSNLGMFGTEGFAAIINPPQSAILAVGATKLEPVINNGAVEVGTVMRLTLSVDHRAIDGALAAEWLRTFLRMIEKPLQILS